MLGLFRRRALVTAPKGGDQRNDNSYLIEMRGVIKEFETAAGVFRALKGIDLRVNAGEFVGVIGKSGSGKSTLINMIAGIDRPTAGEVFVGGTAVHKLSEGDMAVWRGQNLGIVFQFFQLLPTLSLLDNVMLPMDFANKYSLRERHERALYLLDQVGMADQADKLPSAVSGGQQQRVAIARALANDPPILIADEPTGNLDSRTADSVFKLFESLVAQGKTVLVVTHDHDLAKRVMRTLVISDGEIIEEYLARVFPSLTEEQLVRATRGLRPQRYAPGSIIISRGEPSDKLYLVTRGRAEVFIRGPLGQEIIVAHMDSGQYFGEIELVRGGERIATVRAAHDVGVEVAVLDRETFASLLKDSAGTREQVQRIVEERFAEHQATDHDEEGGHA